MIPSPYNFVPLSETVFFPDWAHQVSMDIPFSDGLSGTLELTVTACTPIYIRSGGAHLEGRERLNDARYLDFFRVHDDGPYAIPGSSLKGMLRNVVEITSFGKVVGGLSAPRVDDRRYAVRDLTRAGQFYTSKITKTEAGGYTPTVQAAWLREDDNGNWSLQFCEYSRVEQEALESMYAGVRLGTRQSTKDKYQQLKTRLSIQFTPEPVTNHHHTPPLPLRYSKAVDLGKGKIKGTIVLTGQPSNRQPPGQLNFKGKRKSRGKHLEFIFHSPASTTVPVPEKVRRDFVFAHSDLGENRKPNAEWEFWGQRLKNNQAVPVFVLASGSDVRALGLAQMFRLPYTYSIHEVIRKTHADHLDGKRPDLAELLFGRVEDQEGLRGRVAIETLIATSQPQSLNAVLTVLNAPKPTYYPNYVQQHVQGDGRVRQYTTYMDQSARIRGWKRYITCPDSAEMPAVNPPPRDQNGRQNLDVATSFRPLPAGTVFTGTLHFHNLRPAELGALVWAITWGGDNNLRHSLGMAKPYGFGSVSIAISASDMRACNPQVTQVLNLEACRAEFVQLMTQKTPAWATSDQLRALKVIANPQTNWPQERRYPTLGDGPGSNEFVQAKRDGGALVHPLKLSAGSARGAGTGGSHQPSSQNSRGSGQGKSAADLPRKAVAPASNAAKFVEGLANLSLKQVPRELKNLKLAPDKVTAEEKTQIYSALKKKFKGVVRPDLDRLLEVWKC